MSLERYKKFKLKKNLRNPQIEKGTEGFILVEPAIEGGSYGVRICGVDMELSPDYVEVESALAS